MSPSRRLNERANRTAVPRWVFGVFFGITVASVGGMFLMFALLYREADHGRLTIPVAAALLALVYVATAAAGLALFTKVALPPVVAQTRIVEQALDQQLEANRRQHDFLVHIHHELRTPVTIVLGATQTLASHGDELSPEQRFKLRDAAYRNAEALSHLVEDLTLGVEAALPGMSFAGHVDNWSSTKARRMAGQRANGERLSSRWAAGRRPPTG